jgi:hypothetical protein
MPSRPQYLAGAPISSAGLSLEQNYRWQHARLHNRLLHGSGVVCGLRVIPAGDAKRPWAVRVCPGYAISPCGDEIEVNCAAIMDIEEWMWALKTPTEAQPAVVLIAVRYLTRDDRPLPAPGEPCRCSGAKDQRSRISDSFRIDVLPRSELAPQPTAIDLCKSQSIGCSNGPPASVYVPLALVALPGAVLVPILVGNVTNLAAG